MKMEILFLFLLVFHGAFRLSAQLPGENGGTSVRLKIPPHLSKADEEKIFVNGMMDKRNDERLAKFKELRALNRKRGIANVGVTLEDVYFQLYRQRDKDNYYDLNIKDVDNLKNAPLDKNLDTKVIVHGWMNSGSSWFATLMKDTLLDAGDANVLVVDWSSYSYGFVYPWTAGHVPEIGEIVGDVISRLISEGNVNISTLHFMGHSLGAHVSGFAGKRIQQKLNKTVPWITGLDPALPCFSNDPPVKRLDKSDGDFVDIIHTCANYLGFYEPIGHIDFYPNGGKSSQPGCGYEVGVCSHSRSFQYYAEALVTENTFIAYPCSSLKDFIDGKCMDADATKRMGQKYDGNSYGKMYLLTHQSSPFYIEKSEDEDGNSEAKLTEPLRVLNRSVL